MWPESSENTHRSVDPRGHFGSNPRAMRFDIYYLTENNRVDPRSLPAKCVTVEAASDIDVNDLIRDMINRKVIAKGSGRCGVTEVQSDAGIYQRVGGNGHARGKSSRWDFKSWDDLEAEELAEQA